MGKMGKTDRSRSRRREKKKSKNQENLPGHSQLFMSSNFWTSSLMQFFFTIFFCSHGPADRPRWLHLSSTTSNVHPQFHPHSDCSDYPSRTSRESRQVPPSPCGGNLSSEWAFHRCKRWIPFNFLSFFFLFISVLSFFSSLIRFSPE